MHESLDRGATTIDNSRPDKPAYKTVDEVDVLYLQQRHVRSGDGKRLRKAGIRVAQQALGRIPAQTMSLETDEKQTLCLRIQGRELIELALDLLKPHRTSLEPEELSG